ETAPVQPGDFVRWQAALLTGPEATRLRNYWMGRLQPEPPPLRLPTAPRTGHASQCAGTFTTRVGAVLTAALRALARAHHATAFETWLGAFFVLLARYSGQTDITVGAPVSGRTRSRFRLLIDHLVNMVALRVDLDGDLTFATALARVRTTVLGALAHQTYPFSCVVEAVNPVRDPTRHPLFQVVFAWQQPPDDADVIFGAYALGVSGAPLQIGALEGELIALEPRELPFDLIVSAGEVGDSVALCWQYHTDLFAARTIERLAENYTTLLAGIAEAPDVP